MNLSAELAEAITGRIVNAIHPRRIILFGSAARDEAGPGSDVDLLVIVSDGTHRRRTAQELQEHLMGFAVPIDIVVATESDVATYGSNFSLVLYPALREGVDLYVG